MTESGSTRVSPASSLLVTRVRPPSEIRTAYATVLFADLRGYTGMVESLPAAHVVPLLDEFFRVLDTAAQKYAGKVYYMAGDGIMAGFGVNGESGGGAAEALAAGHAMLDGFAPVAERWHSELSVDAGIGIGLHLGEVAFCVLGPSKRRTTTLVGDTVNVAARLCSRARAGEVLFSCTVAAALSISADTNGHAGSTSFLQLPQFELRGRRGPIDIWCVPAPERLAL
ncbi:MAG: adenylate/guanylate cyclase domain-containing protein [Pseudomonadota bacterium]|nr:adenylate/guanylate cyclase domain-containing protein [Pseudomonadota bacterium]